MNAEARRRILQCTGAQQIANVELIQRLWNNYGTLSRVTLDGNPTVPSVVLKHVQIPQSDAHPRGFGSSLSKRRKIRSYRVESHWYQHYNPQIANSAAPTPHCLDAFATDNELFILLEDLSTRGFTDVLSYCSGQEIHVVLDWLAYFHAQFLHSEPEGLWACGTYWHLDTRPDELQRIEDTSEHDYAGFIDATLKRCRHQTLVHGDAKLANFCFRDDRQAVAAVDFQYVGRGCGMKDVAYFIGSCLSERQLEQRQEALLSHYFAELRKNLANTDTDTAALEREWRALYPVACADFQRFMLGWSPRHFKNNTYTQRLTDHVIADISDELLAVASTAATRAGAHIQRRVDQPFQRSSKGHDSAASDILTEVDLEAQAIILEALEPTLHHYDLGLLAEEGAQDDSRLHKHAFWTIDPIDGTLFFAEGQPGYATSIALVSRTGRTLLGVVYDPVRKTLYQAIRGQGLRINGVAYAPEHPLTTEQPPTLFADRSIQQHPQFKKLQDLFTIVINGGAVLNTLQVCTTPNSCYWKAPKHKLGGCAIWDLAAGSLMLEEVGGTAVTFAGAPLHLNRPSSIYFNDVGIVFSSADQSPQAVHQTLNKAFDHKRG